MRTRAYSGSNRQHSLSAVAASEHRRSAFNRSSNYKTTFDSGQLIPIYVDEILPGDTVHMKTSVFARMATPIYPLMDNLYLDFFWFFVPNRLVWDKWAFFMGEEETPGDAQLAPKYSIPEILISSPGPNTLADYFGIPIYAGGVANVQVNALPFRAYNLIWSEWFRDENLQTRPFLTRAGGILPGPAIVDADVSYPIRPRGRRKDYIMGALPWPQKGPTVLLPLGTAAPVTFTFTGSPELGNNLTVASQTAYGNIEVETTAPGAVGSPLMQIDGDGGNWTDATPMFWRNLGFTASANLSSATAATINELRQSFQVQRLLERDSRGGTRLTELIRSHFGVVSPDARLQRPEFLAGATVPISINPVPQTSETTANAPQGNLAAFATAAGRGGSFMQSFTEHGWLMCLASARADLNYQQGLHKMWWRKTRFDHYWPALQSIGEQVILNQEVYYARAASDTQPFGYAERWSEYRYRPNIVTGQFRSDSALPLDSWHLALDFSSLPALNASLIEDRPPISRVVAVPSEPEFLLDAFFHCKHVRPLPVFSVPGMIDHF